MKQFLWGVLVGIVITSVGFTGLLRMLDKSVDLVRTHSVELAR